MFLEHQIAESKLKTKAAEKFSVVITGENYVLEYLTKKLF